jgi:hypothetical protein
MKLNYVNKPTSITELLEAHRANPQILSTRKLKFLGVNGFDVYNICQAFVLDKKTYLAGRVEQRNSEISNLIIFEKVSEDTYQKTPVSLAMMQDPCMCMIDDEIIIGGTEIFTDEAGRINSWNTSFFRGRNLSSLEKFASAPAKMKDVRIAKGNEIFVFSRPQGGEAKGGRIGFTTCTKLEEVNEELINNAPLLHEQFTDECWGGVNQIHILKNNLLGIVGHIAIMSAGDVRHYYGMVFCFNPKTRQSTAVKIICERKDFEDGATKREDLKDVVFLGGLCRNNDHTATLYTGLSDAEAHLAVVNDPFLEYEKGDADEN